MQDTRDAEEAAAIADRRAGALLVLGMLAGIALAALGILRSGAAPPPSGEGAIAVVNGAPISREAFARFVAAVAAERKQLDLDTERRRRLLERMIDEELLFQRGEELGLARHEPSARRAIVAALVASVSADAEAEEPDEAALRAFYAENRERFTRPGRLRLEVAFVGVAGRSEDAALRSAEELARRVRAGEDFARVRDALADDPVAPLPEAALPYETIRQYLGPTPARYALGLRVGEVGDPTRGSDGYYVVRLAERLPGAVLPFEAVRGEVRSELLRSLGDRALRDYLAALRDDAEVAILDPDLAAEPGG